MLLVIPITGPVILEMMKTYAGYLGDLLKTGNKAGESITLELIGLILHIFYSLNCIDLPEYFEDHMNEWMTYYKALLELNYESESLRKCKTRVIKVVTLYCEKYASDFKDYLPSFFTLIYNQIEQTNMEPEYDKVILFSQQ
jgi:exportin-2 (importin alpha re-exporter)